MGEEAKQVISFTLHENPIISFYNNAWKCQILEYFSFYQEEKKEEVKPEEKKEEKSEEEKKEEEKPKAPLPFVLFVDLHCVGCAKKIERSILKIRGMLINLLTFFVSN